MDKGSEVQIVTDAFVLFPLIYVLVCSRGYWGSSGCFQRGLAGMPLQPDRLSLFASVSSPLHPCWSVLSFADLYKTHTSGNQWFPSRFFFLLPELLVMTCSLGGLKWLSSLSWTRSVPKFTLESVFPGPNPPWCAIPISGYLGSYKSGSRPQKQRVVRSLWRWVRCDLWSKRSQPAQLKVSWNP